MGVVNGGVVGVIVLWNGLGNDVFGDVVCVVFGWCCRCGIVMMGYVVLVFVVCWCCLCIGL